MNSKLLNYLKIYYPDLNIVYFSAFIIRNTKLAVDNGHLGFMTPYVWMFISSYEKLRNFILDKKTITTLIQLEYSGFEGALQIPICTFTIQNKLEPELKGSYIKLSNFKSTRNQPIKSLEAIKNQECGWFYNIESKKFKAIPGSPIVYWCSDQIRNAFSADAIKDLTISDGQTKTGDNDRYLRFLWEVDYSNIGEKKNGLSIQRVANLENGMAI